MVIKVLFKGFNFSQDGPGNRLVYHLQGCNMRCPWCSTPESMPEEGTLLVSENPDEKFCPFGAVKNGQVNRTQCAACSEKPCTKYAGSKLRMSYTEMDIDAVVDEIESSTPMFFDGGGVTFTGGEPTVQFDALKELLTRLKRLGIHTALETNGSHIDLPELFELIDWMIIDCKHYDNSAHLSATGIGNETILKNIAAAAKKRSQLLIRIPLINGFNASEKDAEKFAAFFLSMDFNNCSFELLRYHEYGKDKWGQCGMKYTVQNAVVSDEAFAKFKNVFLKNKLQLIRT